MESSTIRHHASSSKEFLMSGWIKGDTWEPMKTAITKLTTHLEGYVDSYLARKRTKTQGSCTSMSVTDSMHIRSLSVVAIPPTDLKPLIDELNKRENHESVFVRDFSPENRMKRFRYIHLLEKGLPFPALLYTYSIGGSIGNYHFVWKIPVNTNFDSILTESQQTIERIKKDIPKYHHRCLRQELLQK